MTPMTPDVPAICAESDSDVYRHTFFGILNADGQFWTPLAFPSEKAARSHIEAFWSNDLEKREQCLRTHRIVPVRIRLTAKPAHLLKEQQP
ncbi:hypothetical protein [Sphingomonas melonis]|uniref:hypothetical protein n=1 Tax=Sphingomonas melonis TaxID=152682 RepID=UPI00367EC7FC